MGTGSRANQTVGDQMSKHTPGPWKWDYAGGAFSIYGASAPNVVNRVMTITKGVIPGSADAHLIAAAPELLEAAKALLEADKLTPGDCYDANGNPNANWGRIDRAKAAMRAAIAKAEGK